MEMIDAIKGALYGGVAIGDALGGTTEFMSEGEIKQKYGWIEDIIGGGCGDLKPGETTDDTAMTIAVAKGILQNPSNPIPHIGEAFLAWKHTNPKDIGNIIRTVFRVHQGDCFQAARKRII